MKLPNTRRLSLAHTPASLLQPLRYGGAQLTDLFEGLIMRETRISIPELGLVAGTRAMLGAGIGLLLADRLTDEQRRAIGWTLLFVGVLSTIPLGFEVFGGHRLSGSDRGGEQMRGETERSSRLGEQNAFVRS
jgi:hypothetical protein